ncbi:hypothetical protein MYG81_003203 [Escherichia coli]|nr:hypothetical protein [Escherichia coli]
MSMLQSGIHVLQLETLAEHETQWYSGKESGFLPETFLSKKFQSCLYSNASGGVGLLGFLCFSFLLVFINTFKLYSA